MSENPLEPDPAREARIRERAYHLWEADGCPHGRDRDYWERAEALIGMEDHAGAALKPKCAPTLPRSSRTPGWRQRR